MKRSARLLPAGLLISMGLLLTACALTMKNQPRYKPLGESDFFPDGQASRPLVEDTVPREAVIGNDLLTTGMVNGQPSDSFPFPITLEVLQRGQEEFDIYCSPCHGLTGYGDGMIVQRGFPTPPSFNTDDLRGDPVGHYFDVITNGFGRMYSYSDKIVPEDRWAIVAYMRALQFSQNAPVDALSPEDLNELP